MLHLLGSLWSSFNDDRETKILFLGDANSGKTALFERFKILLRETASAQSSSSSASGGSTAAPSSSETTTLTQETGSTGSDSLPPDASPTRTGLSALKAEMERRQREEEQRRHHTDGNTNSADGSGTQKLSSHGDADDDDATAASSYTHLPKFTTPTIGLNVGRGSCVIPNSGQKINALFWDVGGDASLRQLWDTYAVQCHGVVFVSDLTTFRDDREGGNSDEEKRSINLLHSLMKRPDLRFAPFLIVGAKYDKLEEDSCLFGTPMLVANRKQGEPDFSSATASVPLAPPMTPASNRKARLHAAMLRFMRHLRFDDLILSSTAAISTSSRKPVAGDAGGGVGGSGSSSSSSSSFVDVDYRQICAADAADAVNVAPTGSVSGIVGHMYKILLTSAEKPTERNAGGSAALREAMNWILSVSAASKARAATIPQEE